MVHDYTPLMDKYPELHLRPVSEFPDHLKIVDFDYVQNHSYRGEKALNGYFYLIVKDGKYGVYMCDFGFFGNTTSVAVKPEYEMISFIYFNERSFGIIIKKNGKYGMHFWEYGIIFNNERHVDPMYDSMEKIENNRFRAIKDNHVTYFDMTGKILR